jgi:hypothetical protein
MKGGRESPGGALSGRMTGRLQVQRYMKGRAQEALVIAMFFEQNHRDSVDYTFPFQPCPS